MFLLSARFPEVYYVQKITKGKVATIFKAMEISCLENQYAISVPIICWSNVLGANWRSGYNWGGYKQNFKG